MNKLPQGSGFVYLPPAVPKKSALLLQTYRISDLENPELGTAEEEAMGTVLVVLASCDVRGKEEAIHAARGLRSVAHGFATLEEAGGFVFSLDPDESLRKLMGAFAAGLRSGGS